MSDYIIFQGTEFKIPDIAGGKLCRPSSIGLCGQKKKSEGLKRGHGYISGPESFAASCACSAGICWGSSADRCSRSSLSSLFRMCHMLNRCATVPATANITSAYSTELLISNPPCKKYTKPTQPVHSAGSSSFISSIMR